MVAATASVSASVPALPIAIAATTAFAASTAAVPIGLCRPESKCCQLSAVQRYCCYRSCVMPDGASLEDSYCQAQTLIFQFITFD